MDQVVLFKVCINTTGLNFMGALTCHYLICSWYTSSGTEYWYRFITGWDLGNVLITFFHTEIIDTMSTMAIIGMFDNFLFSRRAIYNCLLLLGDYLTPFNDISCLRRSKTNQKFRDSTRQRTYFKWTRV